MNLDRDLRDALQPLGGDPVEDARAVLAALPGGGADGPERAPKGLPIAMLLLGVLAAGIGVGWALSSAFPGATSRPEDGPPVNPQPAAQPDDQQDQQQDKQQKPDWPMSEPQGLLLMAFGEVAVNEPRQPREALSPGAWQLGTGTLFETGDSLAGLFVYGNGAAVRFDRQTVGAVENDRLTLRAGRVWLSTVTQPAAWRIEAELATVLSNGAELMVTRAANRVTLTVLVGEAMLRARSGESRRVEAMHRCEVDATGMLGEVASVPFAGTLTGWMAPMILKQTDDSELYARIDEMAAAYVDGAHRDAAEVELRQLGASPVSRLFKALDRVIDDKTLVHRTAALIGDLADYQHKDWLFAMLERGDEETRAIAFRTLVRVTGTEVEDESFWRAGTAGDREIQLRRWRAK